MVDAVKRMLRRMGIPEGQIKTDFFAGLSPDVGANLTVFPGLPLPKEVMRRRASRDTMYAVEGRLALAGETTGPRKIGDRGVT